jgi:zinc protease
MRRLMLALALPAGVWGQAMSMPPAQGPAAGAASAKKPAEAAPARAAAKEPAYPMLHTVQFPKWIGSQLPNGLKLYLVEDHELPVVQGYVIVRAGSVFDPAERPGLAHLTLELMRSGGTRGKRAAEWDEALDGMGARVEVVFSETTGGFSFSAPRQSTGELLRAIAAMLAEPAFRVEKLEVAKAIGRSTLIRRPDDSDEAALRLAQSVLYGRDSAYGRPETEAGIAQLQRSDVTQFHGRYYVPANTALAIQGDFDPAALQAEIEKLFGGWTAAQGRAAELPKAAAAPAGTYVAPARSLLRARLLLGQVGSDMRDRDSAVWEVLAEVLGGTRRSRLMEHVRSPVPGDTLEVGAEWMPKVDYPGILRIGGSCSEPALSAMVEGIQNEIKRLATAPVTEEELRVARDAALAKVALGMDTKAKRLSMALAGEIAGLPAGFAAQYQAAIAAVTRADVDRVAKTLDPAHLTLLAIGDTEDIQRQLKGAGRTATILESAARTQKPQAAPPDAQAVERGRQLMARAQQAAGGAEKVAALKDATRIATFDYGVLAGGGRQVFTQRWLAPSHFREETGVARYAIYTNGVGGFVTDGITSNSLSGALYDQVHAELLKFYPRLLLGDTVPGRTIFAVDGDTVEIREGSRTARLVFDEGGLPSEMLLETSSTKGLPIAVEEILEDFRVVDGLKMPFRIRILHNGQPATLVTVQELKVNSGLKIEDLIKRQ